MDVYLERGVFVLGESMKLKIDVENNSNESLQQMKVEVKNVSLVSISLLKFMKGSVFFLSNCLTTRCCIYGVDFTKTQYNTI